MMIEPHKLHAYADGEATPDEIREIEACLPQCAHSQAELDCIQTLKRFMGGVPVQDLDHSELWTTCRGRLIELDAAKRTQGFVGKYAWAFASGIVGLIVLTGVARRGMTSPSVGSADLAQIMSQIGPGTRPTADPEDQRVGEGLLRQARLAISDERLRLVGVAEGRCENGMFVRRMTLRDGRGQMALLDLPGPIRLEGLEPVSGTTLLSGQLDTMNCVVWTVGDRTLVLVGDREPGELARAVDVIHASR